MQTHKFKELSMKAIRVHEFGGPEVLMLEDTPKPEPAPGQVLVNVKAIGVNPADTYIRSGVYPLKPNLPYTPGGDAGGVVEAVGPNVTRFKSGDRVYTHGTLTGCYSEFTLCKESRVQPLSAKASFAQGAAMGTYETAYRALFQKARAIAGETLLVRGATGGVGIAAVQIARGLGMKIIGTGGTDKGRMLVAEQGAHHVIDHHAPDFMDKVMAATSGRGADVILEMLANVNLGSDLKLLAMNGCVVVIGSRGPVEINPRDAMSREGCIICMTRFNTPDQDLAHTHAGLVAGLETGILRPVIGREFPLAEAATAHTAVMEPGAYGKMVLVL
jgi:NADPH:quinone reductase